jgi:hypothetical protein
MWPPGCAGLATKPSLTGSPSLRRGGIATVIYWGCTSVLARHLLGTPELGSNFTDLPENICHVGADICKQRSDTDRYPAGLRELAARARRLAQELTDEAEAKQFIGIADEMEGKAAALEAHTQAERLGPSFGGSRCRSHRG